MKFVIITVSLFLITGIAWSFTPYFVPREYILVIGLIPMTLSMPMALALALYKYNMKIIIKDKKLQMVSNEK
jgi:hypothetical protein